MLCWALGYSREANRPRLYPRGHVFKKRKVPIACIIYNTKPQGVTDMKEETQRLPEL